jgi:homogentisate 1,2-dioxygenase
MEIFAPRQALDRLDRVTFGLDRKHQARADQATIDHYAAGAAVTRTASLFASGEVELVTQYVQQSELRLAQKLGGLTVDGGRYVMLTHRRSPARS